MPVPPATPLMPDGLLSAGVSLSAFDGSRLRVVLMLDIHDGAQQEFLAAYERMRDRVAATPGHLGDQLCQCLENPTQWLITSEWESAAPFLAWVNSDEHLDTVEPFQSCVRDTRSMRYTVLRETGGARSGSPATAHERPTGAVRIGGNVVRHALTFTVRTGSEPEVARILSGYASPAAQVDDTTRLLRTSLYLHGNRVVRAIEVRGELQAALRHVARQPEVRAVEEAINPYLEQDRDLADPQSARRFFTRAALPAVHHAASRRTPGADTERYALHYPGRPGAGEQLARLLARQDAAAVRDATGPVLAATVFHRDDLVVRLVEVTGGASGASAAVLALPQDPAADRLEHLLDLAASGIGGPLTGLTDDGTLRKLFTGLRMRLLTDRTSPAA